MKKEKKEHIKKIKKDGSRALIIVLIILFVIELLLIPGFMYAGMKKALPTVAFIIIPTLFALFVVVLCKTTWDDCKRKYQKLAEAEEKEEEKE
ncbi:MAG: hypothetical protein E7168_04695 [Firmicutes bacterium]|nr:hypothetical protein [Bacillota bacterium]